MKGFIKTVLITLSLLLIISIKGEASTLTPPNVQLLGNADGLVQLRICFFIDTTCYLGIVLKEL